MREPNDTSMLHVKKCANVPTREGYKVHGINNNEARHPCPAHGESSVWFECTSCTDEQKAYRCIGCVINTVEAFEATIKEQTKGGNPLAVFGLAGPDE